MEIGIIGTGKVGSALAKGWAEAGHRIILGARYPAKARDLAAATRASVVSPAEVGQADVIVLATPWAAAHSVLAGLGDLTGKIVIDCTNPLGPVDGRFGLLLGHTTSGAEELAALVPQARLVKTLNQVGAEVMGRARTLPIPPVMFMAADDAAAKDVVGALLQDLGFDPLDAGDLSKARLLEPFALVWINQALAQGKGRDWALTVQAVPDV